MMEFPLQIEPTLTAQHEPAAWFIPGADVAAWLAEMARFGLPMAELELFVLPVSMRDRRPSGVLVRAKKGQRSKAGATVAQAYGCLGGKVYLPVEARLAVPVAASEIAAAVAWEVLVLHPTAGAVGFAAGEAVRVADLVRPVPARAERRAWDRARLPVPIDLAVGVGEGEDGAAGSDDGEAAPRDARGSGSGGPRLRSVEVATPPTAGDVVEQGKGDIGSESGEASPKPPAGPGAVRRGGAALGAGLVNALDWVAKKMGSKGGGVAKSPAEWAGAKGPRDPLDGASGESFESRWARFVRDWVARQIEAMSPTLESTRQREIDRLMNLLGSDPDEGLRYALPLAPTGESRGVAPPGGRLGERNPTFDLSRLGGGRPADPWALEAEQRAKLAAKYREAANRELRLGRFRRAAYIYAHLLADFDAAANALKQGRFYREAAVLYRDRLRRELAAAECLRDGGLLAEAIPLFENLARWETAGDLYAQLEQIEEAKAAYLKLVEQRKREDDPVDAARVLEQKVSDAEAALAVLRGGWPKSRQAGRCLQARLDLLGRLGRHEDSRGDFRELREGKWPVGMTPDLVKVLGGVVIAYPDRATRTAAADLARVLIGRRLPTADVGETTGLTRALAALDPVDRLLNRDAMRFATEMGKRRKAASPGAAVAAIVDGVRKRAAPPTLIRTFDLPETNRHWLAVALDRPDRFWACCPEDHEGYLLVMRGTWDGRMQAKAVRGYLKGDHLRLALSENNAVELAHICRIADMSMFETSDFGVCDGFDQPAWAVEEIFPGQGAHGLCVSERLMWRATVEVDQLILKAFAREGADERLIEELVVQVQQNEQKEDAPLSIDREIAESGLRPICATVGNPWIPMVERGGHLYLAVRDQLVQVGPQGKRGTLPLRHGVLELAVSPRHGRSGVIAALTDGAVLVWADSFDDGKFTYFAYDLPNPRVIFTNGGHIVTVSGKAGRVYRVSDRVVEETVRFDLPAELGDVIGLTPGPSPDSFAVFGAKGRVMVYRI